MVVLAADPDHFPGPDHVLEAWTGVVIGDSEVDEAVTIVERITNLDSDSLGTEAVVVADTEISVIIATVTIVGVEETEDGWEMVEVVLVVAVFEAVNADVQEAVHMTVSTVNAARTIVTGVPWTMRKVEATGRIHPVPMRMIIGTKMLTQMCHTIHAELERMRVWKKLRR